jgi:hypothetical protein
MGMLTKSDKAFIQGIVDKDREALRIMMREEIKKFFDEVFNVEMTFEETVTDKNGNINPTGKMKTIKVNPLHFMCDRQSGIEGAWRGYQADIDRMKSRMMQYNGQLEQLSLTIGTAIEKFIALTCRSKMVEIPNAQFKELESGIYTG